MNLTTYEFEDIDVGEDLFVTGSADLEWKFDSDEPDVGYRGGYDFEITRISVETKHGNIINLNNTDDLYKDIEQVLVSKYSDNIIEQVAGENNDRF
jgi:hypothetical protein